MPVIKLHCVRVEKERGEEVRRELKEHSWLRRDATISCNREFIYLPLREGVKSEYEALKDEIGVEGFEVLTHDFELLENKRSVGVSIEDIIGFKPSYEIIGDIAVLTSDFDSGMDERVIGEEIMKRHKNIKVVAKRISGVEGVYRRRRMKIVGGENRTETVHKENGGRYKVDLEKVYFNPRLATERNRVASQVDVSGEEIIDMFAGVGPFSIQIARRSTKSHVTAIDINPDAIKYLRENVKLNGVRNVDVMEGDVKEVFVRFRNKANRIIMNLPKGASLFIAEALSMLSQKGGTIHYYDIASSYSEPIDVVINRAKEKLKQKINDVGASLDLDFRGVKIGEARKVKPYAPYAYIIGIDAEIIPHIGSLSAFACRIQML